MKAVLRANHVDDATPTASSELDRTRSKGEERVILATADIVTGVEVSATLTHDDLAGVDLLTTKALDAKTLSV
jgi:hypothetical protein